VTEPAIVVEPPPPAERVCPTCGREWGFGPVCESCGQVGGLPQGVQLSSVGKRLGGYALELVLIVFTAFIGWFVWSMIVWSRGQTPAKQILKMRVVNLQTAKRATWGRMALREFVGKGAVGLVIAATAFGFILYFWLLWDKQRQELWDKIASTVVVDDDTELVPEA
jgi:uncharacterized RDD family membrane protein YckC